MGDIYKALADETRRRILDELARRDEQTLFELRVRLAEQGVSHTRQAISQHLDILEQAGLVHSERRGRYRFHTMDPRPLTQITDRWPIGEK